MEEHFCKFSCNCIQIFITILLWLWLFTSQKHCILSAPLIFEHGKKMSQMSFLKNANIHKYFEPAFVILQACFGSSTSPNSAKKAVKIKSAKSSYMCHRATQICAKDAPGVRIDTGKLGQQLSYLFVPSKAVSVSVSVSLFFFLSSTPYVRTAPTSASTSAHGSFEGSSFWAQKNTQK